jgi:phage terminase large subunit-like protein
MIMLARDQLDASAIERFKREPIAFIEHVLRDPETGKAFILSAAERAFLERAFTLSDNGRLLYPELVFGAIKKSGKTTLAAVIMLVMILLYGGRYAEAICVANDFEQAQSRVFAIVKRIIECSPLLRAIAKLTADKVTFPTLNASIIAIASDAASAAGANAVCVVFDELWGYTSERSRRLWDEMVPPPTRRIACRLTVSYAGFAGESVLLEEIYKRGMQLPEVAPSLHAGDGMLFAWHTQPIAPWQTESWLAEMRRSLRPNAYLRMIENQFVTSETSFIDLALWDMCVDPDATPVIGKRSIPVTIGIDASVKHDSTAIVACTWDKQLGKVVLLWHRIYQPTPDDPLDFEAAIESTVLDLHSRFRVQRVLFDPYQMAAVSQRLARAGVRMEEYPQSVPNITAASQNLYELIQGRNIIAYPDAQLRLALSRAVAKETSRGWHITKEKASHKIDVVVALAMAALVSVQKQSSYETPYGPLHAVRDEKAEAEAFQRNRAGQHILVHSGYYNRRIMW